MATALRTTTERSLQTLSSAISVPTFKQRAAWALNLIPILMPFRIPSAIVKMDHPTMMTMRRHQWTVALEIKRVMTRQTIRAMMSHHGNAAGQDGAWLLCEAPHHFSHQWTSETVS
jgi:hypothetical protein